MTAEEASVDVTLFLMPEEESENYYVRGGTLRRYKSAGPEPESCRSTITVYADPETCTSIIASLRTEESPC